MTREEAIECIEAIHVQMFNSGNSKWTEACDMAIEALKEKRPRGEWIDEGVYADYVGQHVYKCTYCNDRIIEFPAELGSYCKYCGSDNRKRGEDAPKSKEDKKTKKCPICGSDLYEHCFMCCYEGEKVKMNDEKQREERARKDDH